jgi:phospho-2-dehydro-3-deoxyheptonate aldolase
MAETAALLVANVLPQQSVRQWVLSQLKYGVSVTDACIDWATTEEALLQAAALLRPMMQGRKSA